MFDCSNAEVRDSLPDLVNGRLDERAMATVRAHVAGCQACQAELDLIAKVRAVIIGATPQIDTSRIIHSLGTAPTQVVSSQWLDWRIAAAITVIALGGAGLFARGGTSQRAADSLASTIESVSRGTLPNASATVGGAAELSVPGDVDRLTDAQLRTLLDQVGQIDALPAAEGHRVSIPMPGVDSINPKGAL